MSFRLSYEIKEEAAWTVINLAWGSLTWNGLACLLYLERLFCWKKNLSVYVIAYFFLFALTFIYLACRSVVSGPRSKKIIDFWRMFINLHFNCPIHCLCGHLHSNLVLFTVYSLLCVLLLHFVLAVWITICHHHFPYYQLLCQNNSNSQGSL